jgi:hypothetical protein
MEQLAFPGIVLGVIVNPQHFRAAKGWRSNLRSPQGREAPKYRLEIGSDLWRANEGLLHGRPSDIRGGGFFPEGLEQRLFDAFPNKISDFVGRLPGDLCAHEKGGRDKNADWFHTG